MKRCIGILLIVLMLLFSSCRSVERNTERNTPQSVSSSEKDAYFASQQAAGAQQANTQPYDTQIRLVDWTDFIKWNDRSYLSSGSWGGAYVFVPDDLIGNILGTVTETAPTEVTGEFEAQNGMAGWRKPGTVFYDIQGYSKDDYIAVLVDGKYLLYQTRDSETPPFPDSGAWSDRLPPVVSISGIEVGEPKPIETNEILGRRLLKPTDSPPVSIELKEFGIPGIEMTPSIILPIDVDGIPRHEIEPEGGFIPLSFHLPNGFSTVTTLHVGQQSIYHIASPDGIVIMNLQYVQTRFGFEMTPKTYFYQYNEIELGGYPIYITYSDEHGAFVTFESEGILFTLNGGINGDSSMNNLFSLCEVIIEGSV